MEETAQRRSQWESHYQRGETGWDRGAVSPALDHWFGNGNGIPCRVLVPGCGRGYEVAALAHRGFDALRTMLPGRFDWPLFGVALLLMAAPVAQTGWRALAEQKTKSKTGGPDQNVDARAI